MQINRSGRLFNWAYFFSKGLYGHKVDICTLFWRCVLLTPLKIIGFTVGTGVVLTWLGSALFWLPGLLFYNGFVYLGSVVVFTWSVLVVWMADEFRGNNHPSASTIMITNIFQVAGEFIAAKKARFCPLISIND